MRDKVKSWAWGLGWVVMFAAFLFFVPSPELTGTTVTKNINYLEGGVVHYIGESILTKEQFMGMTDGVKDVVIQSDGLDKVSYDFYAPANQYSYLTLQPYSFWDMPMIHMFITIDWWVIPFSFMLPWLATIYFTMNGSPSKTGVKKFDDFDDKVATRILLILDKLTKTTNSASNIVKTIHIDVGNGILAMRTWRMSVGASLYSTARGTIWEGGLIHSDKLPQKDNNNGIYGVRLGATRVGGILGAMVGIVEMTGRYEYHGDTIIRAERCEIKLIICHSAIQRRGRAISAKYGVPVFFSSDPLMDYHKWLFGDNGMMCMKHNAELLNSPTALEEAQDILTKGKEDKNV